MIQHCLGGSFLENTPFCKGMSAVLPYSGTLVRISDCIYPGSDAEFPVCHCSCPCVYYHINSMQLDFTGMLLPYYPHIVPAPFRQVKSKEIHPLLQSSLELRVSYHQYWLCVEAFFFFVRIGMGLLNEFWRSVWTWLLNEEEYLS